MKQQYSYGQDCQDVYTALDVEDALLDAWDMTDGTPCTIEIIEMKTDRKNGDRYCTFYESDGYDPDCKGCRDK